MKVYRSLEGVDAGPGTVVALGNFDGVHIAHRKILETAVREAAARGCLSACYTFSNHPREFFKDLGVIDRTLGYICTDDEKLELIEAAGIDVVVDIPFDGSVMKMPPDVFVGDVLAGTLKAKGVSCGFNYRFGAKAAGDTEMLRREGSRLGFDVFVHDAVEINGMIVSSTAIRQAIEAGDMETASAMLGRYFSATGEVVRGTHIGTRIGAPTANIAIDRSRVAPPNGVYYTYSVIGGKRMPSVTNVGVKPTVGDFEKSIETHVFGAHGELYGEDMEVDFIKWKRPERKFDSIDELRRQIDADMADAAAFHGISAE
jgi:riboflavin kinase/FMN adenylyltransferase